MSEVFYVAIDVFRRHQPGELVIYRCFRILPHNKFVVQSADFVRHLVEEKTLQHHQKNLWELLIEEAPEDRSKAFDTIEEAIADFDRSFS